MRNKATVSSSAQLEKSKQKGGLDNIFNRERALYNGLLLAQFRAPSKFLGKKRRSTDDVMWDDAVRQYDDFKRREHIEFLEWQKSLKVTTNRFKEKADNFRNHKNTDINNLIFMMGGGNKCISGAGQVISMDMMGITADTVNTVIGASGGAVAATAYVGGKEQILSTTEMMLGPLSSKDFIDVKRMISGNMVNLGLLRRLLDDEEGKYYIDQDKIRETDTNLFYAVTIPVKGDKQPELRYINAKDVSSMTEAITASMSLPMITGPIPKIDGEEYHDGAITPFQIEELIDKFNPTDILILPQTPFAPLDDIKPLRGDYIKAAIAWSLFLNSLEKGLLAKKILRKSLEDIKKTTGVNIGIIWPPDGGLTTFGIDRRKSIPALIDSVHDTLKQWGAGNPTDTSYLDMLEELVCQQKLEDKKAA